MKVGIHCSVRNGFAAALREAHALGCDTLQIFTQSPRGWRTRVYAEEEFTAFRQERAKLGMGPVVVHSPYLPNLCTSDEALYRRSIRAFTDDLQRCEKLGAEYLVIHVGAFSPDQDLGTGLKRLSAALEEVLGTVPGKTQVLIENVAGGGRRIGGLFAEIRKTFEGVRERDRLGVCFDTCHALGAGYNLARDHGVDAALKEFDQEVGLEAVKVFHVNDSKAPLGSHRDLHQHIGRGHVGLEGFRRIFRHPAFKDRALILETPKDSLTADRDNMTRLRACLPREG